LSKFWWGLAVGWAARHVFGDGRRARTVAKPAEPSLARPRVMWRNVTFLTTWEVRCGIACYSRYLTDALKGVKPDARYDVVQISAEPKVEASLLHWQFEPGISPKSFRSILASGTIITMHGVSPAVILSDLDAMVDAYIVHNEPQLELLSARTKKPVYLIPHGAYLFSPIPKDEARRRLNLPKDGWMIYAHGVGEGKHFDDIVRVLPKLREEAFLLALASPPEKKAAQVAVDRNVAQAVRLARKLGVLNRVRIVKKWVDEDAINLYASAADAFVFNYKTPPELIVSASGAVKRVIVAGKPVVCTHPSEDARLADLKPEIHCLSYRFGDLDGMLDCFRRLMEDRGRAEWLGLNCRLLAFRDSWLNVARRHVEVYNDVWARVVS